MKKSEEYAEEIIDAYNETRKILDMKPFVKTLSNIHISIAVNEFVEIKKKRNIETDNDLVSIFKELRQKYGSITKQVNKSVKRNLLNVAEFDEIIKSIYANIYDWYEKSVIE